MSRKKSSGGSKVSGRHEQAGKVVQALMTTSYEQYIKQIQGLQNPPVYEEWKKRVEEEQRQQDMVRWCPRDLMTGTPRLQINDREYYVTTMTMERWIILTYLGAGESLPVCHKVKVQKNGFTCGSCSCPSYRVSTGCKHTKALSRALRRPLSPVKFESQY